ncbi:MAG: membrane protein insertase YidC [Gammaproteobacteria bacterium]|nr:membrane protein insertase YidC [Gammaproteobacteria bacterium]
MNQTIVKYALYAVIAGLTISLLSEWNRFSRDFDDKRASELRQQQSGFNATDPGGLTSAGSANSEAAVASNNAAANSASNNQASFNDSPFEDSTTPAAALIAEPAGADAIVAKPAGGASAGTIQVDTDTLRVLIDKAGGDIIEVALKQHLSSLDNDAEPLRLLEKNGLRVYTAQSGLIAKQSGAVRAVFNSEQQQYTMQAGQPLDVVLRYTDENGIELNKIYRFEPGLHTINVSYQIKNNSQQSWQASFYAQISRDNSKDPGTENAGFGMQSYLGAATTTEESPYQKIPFKDIEKNDFRNAHTNGWIAMIQHYFVSAWVPPRDVEYQYFTKRANNGLNIIGMYSHPVIVPPGGSETTGALFYAGPKNQYRLAEIAEHLDLTIDYGWLWMLAQPLYALLYFFATGELHVFGKVFDVFGGFNNWGFAIIMLTVVVKLLFFRLSASSYR